MATELRKTGIGVVGDIPWGTHFCHFYETKQDLLDILLPYFKTGLENNEFCMWVVADPLGEEDARNALRQAFSDADQHLAAGRIEIIPHTHFFASQEPTSSPDHIEIIPHTQWYLKDGAFIAGQVIRGWNDRLAGALRKGFAGMRANGNEAWLTAENWKAFALYEKTLDETLTNQRMIVLCSYPLSGASAAEIFDVVQTHQFAIVRRKGNWEVVETPELIQAKREIKRLNEELEQRVIERTAELAAANEALRREITERKRAEEALRRSEDRLRLVIDTIPIMAWSVQPDGTVDFVNRRWLDYTGLSFEEEIERPTRAIHPEDLPRVIEKWRADMADGRASEDEMRMQGADGEYRWFLVRTAPLRDEQGNVVKWYGVSIDIQERKQAEAALRRSEDRLRLVIETIPAMVFTALPDGSVDFVNQRWLQYMGLSLEDVRDWGWKDTIHPEDRDRSCDHWRAAMAAGQPAENELRVRRADGVYHWILGRFVPLRDESGKIVKWYGVSTDIDNRKRAEEQLKRSNEELHALSARLQSVREEETMRIAREIHDELGATLSSLRWDLEEVEEIVSESADLSPLADLRQKIAAMIRLAETIIDTVRRIASELRPTALDEFGLSAALQWHAQQFQARTGIVVDCDCSLDNLDLNREQATAIFRIFQEALTNILRHAQATRVEVVMKQAAGDFVLTISDNGKGITEAEKSVRSSLGLLGMRERAHLIGGEIDIAGAEGQGTVITLRVPIPAAPK
jgi:PAS domain S-box-containing protein